MTGWVREWLLALTCAALAASLAQALAPEGAPRRICRLAGGLVLLLAAVGPVVGLEEGDLSALTENWRSRGELAVQSMEEENDLLYQAIIETRAAAYIVDKAEALGVSCQAQVTCRSQGEQALPLPWEARVTGELSQSQRQAISQLLEADLGIPPERQSFGEARS